MRVPGRVLHCSPVFRFLLGLILSCSCGPAAFAQAEAAARGAAWLSAQQGLDGSFGETTAEDPIVATSEAKLALGVNDAAQLYLSQTRPSSADLLARKTLALRDSAWGSPDDARYLEGRLRSLGAFVEGGGTGGRADQRSNLDLALMLLATLHRQESPAFETWIRPARTRADALHALIARLQAERLDRGGFGLVDEGADLFTSALLVEALYPLRGDLVVAALSDAVIEAQIIGKQRVDGAFGDGTQPVLDTAQALLALRGLDASGYSRSLTDASAAGSDYLLGAQWAGGSWEGSVRVTALVLRALGTRVADLVAPTDELGIAYLQLSDPAPLAGGSVQAWMDVANLGLVVSSTTTVRFEAVGRSDGSRRLLAESPLAPLAPGARTTVSAKLVTAGLGGDYVVEGRIDPNGLIREASKANNVASAAMTVRQVQNLVVASSDISFTDLPSGEVKVAVRVRAQGRSVNVPVVVNLYRGNPVTGGALLGSVLLPGVDARTQATASFIWDPAGANGATPIHTWVDAAEAVVEAREDDNRAFRFYHRGQNGPVDLVITDNDVTVTPNPRPRNGVQEVQIQVRNLGANDALQVEVEVVDTNSTAQLYARTVIDLVPAGGSAWTSVPLQVARSTAIWVDVDPHKRLNDTRRYNNRAWGSATVESYSPVDVAILEFHVTLSHDNLATFRTEVIQRGTEGITLPLVYYRGDPRMRGASEAGRHFVTLGSVTAGARQSRAWDVLSGVAAGPEEVFTVCIDPEEETTDVDRLDNCAWTTSSDRNSPVGKTSLETMDIALSPVGAEVGEVVDATITIHNDAAVASSGVVVLQLGDRNTLAERTRLGRLPFSIGPTIGATTTVEARFIRPEGSTHLWAWLEDLSPRQILPGKTVAVRDLFLDTLIDTGRTWRNIEPMATPPVTGDLDGNGTPEVVFGELDHKTLAITAWEAPAPGAWQERWSTPVPGQEFAGTFWMGPTLVDLDGDGMGEVIGKSVTLSPSEVHYFRLAHDGRREWLTTLPVTRSPPASPSLGDINGDGIVDVIDGVDGRIIVLDGASGTKILDAPAARTDDTVQTMVVDVEGDGRLEILYQQDGSSATSGQGLMDDTGARRWEVNQRCGRIAVVDLDLDGQGEVVCTDYRTALSARELATGQPMWSTAFDAWNLALAIADFRQDGTPYIAAAKNTFLPELEVFDATGTSLWYHVLPRIPAANPRTVVLADLYGLGRPQIISQSLKRAFAIQDGRDGRRISGSDIWGGDDWDLAIADVDGDGHGELLRSGTGRISLTGIYPDVVQTPAAVAIYGSHSWAEMPTVWNTHPFLKGQVNETLAFQSGYQPWLTHNTFNAQFVGTSPSRLLADLVVEEGDLAVAPDPPLAGDAATVTAVVHNVGGLEASLFDVELWDGDPDKGGRLADTVAVAGPIPLRGGAQAVSLAWTPTREGEHFLHVVVNPLQSLEESGYENNQAATRIVVGAGTLLCDLAITPSGVTVLPATPEAGSDAAVSLVVQNLGVVESGDFLLVVWDGLPGRGARLAEATVSTIAAGSQAVVNLPARMAVGSHLLFVEADAEAVTPDRDRGNNIAQIEVRTSLPAQPSLSVARLQLSPGPIYPGRTVTARALIRNDGAGVQGVAARFSLAGRSVADLRIPGLLPPGDTAWVEASFPAPAAGPQIVAAVVDPDDAIVEAREDDNRAEATLAVLPAPAALQVVTDKGSYGVGETAAITTTVSERSGTARALALSLRVLGPDGRVVETILDKESVIVDAGGSWAVPASWSVGNAAPGAHTLEAVLSDEGGLLARAELQVTVLPDEAVFARVSVDRLAYAPGEEALVRGLIRNDSANAPTGALTTRVAIGTSPRFETTRQLAGLHRGGSRETLDLYSVSPSLAPGSYPVSLEVRSASGRVVAASSTTLTIEATRGPAGLTAELSAAPVEFGVGQPVTFTAIVTNGGNQDLAGATLSASVRGDPGLVEESSASTSFSVPAGGVVTVVLPWTDTLLPPGDKVAIVEASTADGILVLGRVLLRATEIADQEPPTVTITGVHDGQATSAAQVLPVVTVTDQSAVTWSTTLDGGPWSAGGAVTAQGDHELIVDAVDAYGNRTVVRLGFAIDRSAPSLGVEGVVDGACERGPVAATFTASDAHLTTVVATLDGLPYAAGTPVLVDGRHHLWVVATDAAGNETQVSIVFVVDATDPVVTIRAVSEGGLYGASVTPEAVVTDANIVSFERSLDGAPYAAGTPVTGEGRHTFVATAADCAGNLGRASATFEIDLTPPSIVIAGVRDGTCYATPVQPVFSATDPHLGPVSATLDARPFVSGTQVSLERAHRLEVHARDTVGNVADAQASFVVDLTPPSIEVRGVQDGAIVAGPVTPEVIVTDTNLRRELITLDGRKWIRGQLVTQEGDHLLVVEAADCAGHVASLRILFTLDRTPPLIVITGVAEAEAYRPPVMPVIEVRELHPGHTSVTLDGSPFVSGTPVSHSGWHILLVQAEDLAGNRARARLRFELVEDAAALEMTAQTGGTLVASRCAFSPQLAEALGAAGRPWQAAPDASAWLAALRGGPHDLHVLWGGTVEEGPWKKAFERLGDELGERVRGGDGLLLVYTPEAEPEPEAEEDGDQDEHGKKGHEHDEEAEESEDAFGLEAALGAEAEHARRLVLPRTMQVTAPELDPPARLQVAGVVADQELEGARAGGILVDGTRKETLLSLHAFGEGRVVFLSFDPDAAPSAEAVRLLEGALRWLSPPPKDTVAPYTRVSVSHGVKNEGLSQTLALASTFPGWARLLGGGGGVVGPGGDAVHWLLPLGRDETARRQITLAPTMAGVSLRVGGTVASDAGTILAREEVTVAVSAGVEGLLPGLRGRVLALLPAVDPQNEEDVEDEGDAKSDEMGHRHHEVEALLCLLDRLAALRPDDRAEAGVGVATLLKIIEALLDLGPEAAGTREAAGDLLLAWERRWAAAPATDPICSGPAPGAEDDEDHEHGNEHDKEHGGGRPQCTAGRPAWKSPAAALFCEQPALCVPPLQATVVGPVAIAAGAAPGGSSGSSSSEHSPPKSGCGHQGPAGGALGLLSLLGVGLLRRRRRTAARAEAKGEGRSQR